jgi:Sulfotransferase family
VEEIRPIFIFALSRSGSTLVQRVIAAHEGVATTSEPWLLLPQVYSLKPGGVLAEYPHRTLVEAIEDFAVELPGGAAEYRREIHDFILRLYRSAAGPEARWFLDKSPYSGIASEVMELFPEGRFVFLWRNPLAVAASNMATWDQPWKPTLFRQQLYVGLPRLVAAFREAGGRAHAARFEDLVAGDPATWRALVSYLGIEFDPTALERFPEVRLKGRMGDPTGVRQYTALDTRPTEKWPAAFANPVRREWCRRYLAFLGEDRLRTMGYGRRLLLERLEEAPGDNEELLADLGRMIRDIATEPLRVRTRNAWLGGPNVIRELLRGRPPIPA